MSTYSIIQKSQLEGANRLDAEYYQPAYLSLAEKLLNANLTKLANLRMSVDASAFYPSVAEFYCKEGIPFLRVADVSNFQIKEEDLVFLPGDVLDQYKTIKQGIPGDIIITKGGTVGNVALLPKNYPKYALSRDIIVIKTSKLPDELSKTILLFLGSNLGNFQLVRGASQQVQPHLTLPLIRNLYIPSKAISEVVKLHNRAIKENKFSYSFYLQAENLLLEELGLKDFKVEYDLSFVVNLSDVKSARRADAEYFQPIYKNLESRIKNYGAKKLADVMENVPARFSPKLGENYRYVELANIDLSIGIIDGFSEVSGEEAPSRAKRLLETGDVIASSVEGSLGKVALVDKEQKGYLASTGFFQFRSKRVFPEVLLVLTKSLVFQMQLQKQTAGTILSAVPQKAIKNILVPVLPRPTQQKIANLVRQSHQARKKSKQLLEETKRKVETSIETQSKGDDRFGILR